MKSRIVFVLPLALLFMQASSFSQNQVQSDITERLSVYIPIFESPNCTTFLNNFGDKEKAVYKNAETIGLEHFSMGKPPDANGTYFHLFTDPENLTDKDGDEISDHVVYTFVFNEEKQYISFAATIVFKSPLIARVFHKSMLEKLGVFRFKNEFSDVIHCKENGKSSKTRMVTLKLDGSNLTFVVIDYDAVLEMAKKVGARG